MATLNASEGAQCLQKIFGGIGCPTLCPQTFNRIQEKILGPNIDQLAEQSCLNATAYEVFRKTGIRNPQDLNPNHITPLEVSQDGFYCKRSHSDRNYSSLAGGK